MSIQQLSTPDKNWKTHIHNCFCLLQVFFKNIKKIQVKTLKKEENKNRYNVFEWIMTKGYLRRWREKQRNKLLARNYSKYINNIWNLLKFFFAGKFFNRSTLSIDDVFYLMLLQFVVSVRNSPSIWELSIFIFILPCSWLNNLNVFFLGGGNRIWWW